MTDSRFDQDTGIDRPPARRHGVLQDIVLCTLLLISIAAAWLYGLALECWRDAIRWATGRE
jgi:hypothetical protein